MRSFEPDRIQVPCAHFIGGRLLAAPEKFTVNRPSDGKPHAGLPLADAAPLTRRCRTRLRPGGTATGRAARHANAPACCAAGPMLVEADVERLAPLEAVCSTRPVRDAAAWDVPFTAEGLRFFAEYADKLGGEVAATRHDHLGMVVAEPYGVVGAITPWNFPLVMASWKVGAALAAGNAVVLKPSELTPYSVLRLAELAVEAGVPPGIFNVVHGDGMTTGEALTRHPLISKMTFTGSTRTGAAIMASCAMHGPKPVTLELGGKSPQLVFDDAPDLERLAGMIAGSITGNAGQVCVAGSRLIVQRRIAAALLERIARALRRASARCDLGPRGHAAANRFDRPGAAHRRDRAAVALPRAGAFRAAATSTKAAPAAPTTDRR